MYDHLMMVQPMESPCTLSGFEKQTESR